VTHVQRSVAGAIGLLAVLAAAYLGAQVGLGAFTEAQRIELVLDQTGQGLVAGSDVSMRGVVVGEVAHVALGPDHRAVVQVDLDPDLRLPTRTRVAVTSKTVLGPKRVDLIVDGLLSEGPHLATGDRLEQTSAVVEVEDILAYLTPVLEAIDPEDLVVIGDDLLGFFAEHGPATGRLLDHGADLAELANRTLDDGLALTGSAREVSATFADRGPAFNRLGAALASDLATLSDNHDGIGVLLDEVARTAGSAETTLRLTRADLDVMLAEGASVTRLLFDYSQQVGEIISGLTLYSSKFASGFEDPTIRGLAARFATQIELRGIAHPLCEAFGDEGLPACEVASQVPFLNALQPGAGP
jgi:phospholipid/cholesterol/gamma-HCH transport system substrate-binding protein